MILCKIKTELITKSDERFFGTLVHSVMEHWVHRGILTKDEVFSSIAVVVLRFVPFSQRQTMKARLESFFDSIFDCGGFSKLVDIIKLGKAYPEVAILGVMGQRFRIDLLVESEDEFFVIDYKVGNRSSEHSLQVRKYCEILKVLNKKINGYLCYLSNDVFLEKVF